MNQRKEEAEKFTSEDMEKLSEGETLFHMDFRFYFSKKCVIGGIQPAAWLAATFLPGRFCWRSVTFQGEKESVLLKLTEGKE